MLLAKIVIVGIPFTLSVGWFIFWIIRIRRESHRLKEGRPKKGPPEA